MPLRCAWQASQLDDCATCVYYQGVDTSSLFHSMAITRRAAAQQLHDTVAAWQEIDQPVHAANGNLDILGRLLNAIGVCHAKSSSAELHCLCLKTSCSKAETALATSLAWSSLGLL